MVFLCLKKTSKAGKLKKVELHLHASCSSTRRAKLCKGPDVKWILGKVPQITKTKKKHNVLRLQSFTPVLVYASISCRYRLLSKLKAGFWEVCRSTSACHHCSCHQLQKTGRKKTKTTRSFPLQAWISFHGSSHVMGERKAVWILYTVPDWKPVNKQMTKQINKH